ncbi:MAG: hypothetical protein Q9221_004114, partial [Calogaya cf. arnoldii]
PFGSQVFQIVVGPSAKTLYAHADVLAKSDVLRMVVNSGGKEKEEGKILWPDWTVGAAERFLEWLYTGDYKCPYPVEASKQDQISREKDEGEAGTQLAVKAGQGIKNGHAVRIRSNKRAHKQSHTNITPRPTKTNKQSPIVPGTQFKDVTWSGSRPLTSKLSEAEEFDKWTGHQLWTPGQLDYEATFMTHAELYNMACTYQMDDLKNMA